MEDILFNFDGIFMDEKIKEFRMYNQYVKILFNLTVYEANSNQILQINRNFDEIINIFSKRNIYNKDGTIDVYYKKYLAPGDKLNCLIFFYADNSLFGNNVLDLSFDGNVGARVEQFVPTPITDFTYTLTNGNVRIT